MEYSAEVFLKNKEKNILETQERRIILESKPLRLGIIVTNWCNLHCFMCTESRYSGGLTLPASVLSKIEELLPYLERMDWQGGEFFNFKYIKEIFFSLKDYPNILHVITTNGLLLDQEWIELLLGLKTELTFSIDSPRRETYEYIRGGASYSELIEKLDLIIELEERYKKRLTRNITVVVMKSNFNHLTEFIPFVKKYRFGSIRFNPIVSFENTNIIFEENIFKKPDLDIQYLDKTMAHLRNKFKELDSDFDFAWSLPQGPDKENTSKSVFLNKMVTHLYCNYPWKSMWICAERNGNVFPDCWCENSIGNIFQESLVEMWNSKNMQKYRKMIIANEFTLCRKECIVDYTANLNSKFY